MKSIPSSCVLAACLAFVTAETSLADAKPLIAEAYKLSKQAKTVDDYAKIVDLCQQAGGTDLSDANGKYVKQLLAWALNRRGERYVDQAANALEEGDDDQAARLDAKALQDFEAAVENDPARWKAVHNRGVSFALAGRYEEAIDDFSMATELKPDYINGWFNLGEIRYEIGHYEEAVEAYNQAVRLAPQDFGAVTSRGHAYFQLGQFADALRDYSQAIELDQQNADAYANRGDAHLHLHHWKRAAADFKHAIELNPSSGRAFRSAAWLMATCPDERFRDGKLGIQAAQQAVELAADQDSEALDILAAAYANDDRFDDAVTAVSQAIKLAPEAASGDLAKRLELYRSGQPYRLSPRKTAQVQPAGGTE